MTVKRKHAIVCITALIIAMLAGCAAATETPTESHTEAVQATQEVITLFDTPTLRIELEGAETRVFDLMGGKEYSYTTTRQRVSKTPTLEQMQARCLARTSVNTDTVKIELAGRLIVVNDRTAEQVYYINR